MIQVNYIAVLAAGVSAMVVGSVWYGPLFGKTWIKLTGISKSDMNTSEMPKQYGLMFLGALVEAYVLSHFIHYAGAVGPILGAKTGLYAAVGFVGASSLGNYIFAKRPMNLFYIDAGYALVNLMIMGAIIASMW